MPTFKNVTDTDLEVVIDGRHIVATAATEDAPAGEFSIPDEWVPSLASQHAFVPADEVTQSAVDAHLATFEVPAEEEEVAPPTKKTTKKADESAPTEEKN